MSTNERTTIFHAPYILPIGLPPISDGAIKIRKGKIVAVSRFRDLPKTGKEKLISLQDSLILPGFVNSHTHLELSCFKGVIKRKRPFSKWVREIIEAKKKLSERDCETSIRDGILESLRGGITSFGDITGTGLSLKVMERMGVRGIAFHELIGFKEEDARRIFAKFMKRIIMFQKKLAGLESTVGIGVSPHSPYSVSPELFKLSCGFAGRLNLPVSIHLSETEEEVRFLKNGNGPLKKLLLDLGSFDRGWNPPGLSPLRYLHSLKVLSPRTSIVHFNFFDEEDLRVAKKSNIKIIYCPKSNNKWFSRKRSPVMDCFKKAIPFSIGTDSLASNDSLNMFDEMRMFKSLYPLFPAKKILKIATAGGACCLGLEDRTGSLQPVRFADFIAVRIPKSINSKNLAEYVVREVKEASLSVINGRIVYDSLGI